MCAWHQLALLHHARVLPRHWLILQMNSLVCQLCPSVSANHLSWSTFTLHKNDGTQQSNTVMGKCPLFLDVLMAVSRQLSDNTDVGLKNRFISSYLNKSFLCVLISNCFSIRWISLWQIVGGLQPTASVSYYPFDAHQCWRLRFPQGPGKRQLWKGIKNHLTVRLLFDKQSKSERITRSESTTLQATVAYTGKIDL